MDDGLGSLMQQIQTITTQDHDVLVMEFRNLVGCSDDMCQFFLEANSWNLQAAIVSYYDAGGHSQLLEVEDAPQMNFVADIVDGERTENSALFVHTNTQFVKTWRVHNCGAHTWPEDVYLVTQTGASIGTSTFDMLSEPTKVPDLAPGNTADVSIIGQAPPVPGEYAMVCRLVVERSGVFFGDELFVFCSVDLSPQIKQEMGVGHRATSLDDNSELSLDGDQNYDQNYYAQAQAQAHQHHRQYQHTMPMFEHPENEGLEDMGDDL